MAIIVGPTGAQTDSYRSSADAVASAATAAGATVVKVYSPNATWANVKNAVNGANIVVYMGHGSGYPNPYNTTETTGKTNGWGLNRTTTNGDGDNWSSTMVYCGERALLGTLTSADGDQWKYCGGSANNDGITPAPGLYDDLRPRLLHRRRRRAGRSDPARVDLPRTGEELLGTAAAPRRRRVLRHHQRAVSLGHARS